MNVPQLTSKHISIAVSTSIVIAVCMGLLFENVSYFYGLDADLLDSLIFYSEHRRPSDKLSLIVVDDESAREFAGDNSILREQYISIIRKLSAFGVRTIAFDLFFGDASAPSTDARLASITDSTQKVIHSFYFPINGTATIDSGEKYAIEIQNGHGLDIIEVEDATFPKAGFIDAFENAGFISYECDKDGTTRRMPLLYSYHGFIYPSLTLASILHYYQAPEKFISVHRAWWGNAIVIQAPDRSIQIPVDQKGQVLLHYYGTLERFSHHPLHQTLKLLQSIRVSNGLDPSLLPFHDDIVLIGNTELNEGDTHNTPFSADFPGVGLHATLISNILNDEFLIEVPWYFNFTITAMLLVLLFCLFFFYLKYSKSLLFFTILAVVSLLVLNSGCYFLFIKSGIWIKFFQVNSTALVVFVFLLFYEKIIHLKKLNQDITDLEQKLQNKSVDLDKAAEKVRFQTEQLKIVTYFANELRQIYVSSSTSDVAGKDEFYAHLLENENILKEQMDAELQRYKKEKQIMDDELLQLRAERQAYVTRPTDAAKADHQPPPCPDATATFPDILSYVDFFLTQARVGRLNQQTTMGVIAAPALTTATGELKQTDMGKLFDEIRNISSYKTTVLITGESGVGKELIAEAIHEQSLLKNKKMVKLDCGAIPETLLESELFGHTKGAYSGAHTDRKGAFLTADGGTIFLDEIGELKLDLQAKLLRALQEKTIKKVGADTPIQVDVRIIAATNRDLETAVHRGEFRQDLYYRLNVLNLKIPPLRERRWDIPFLIHSFLEQFRDRYGESKSFSEEAYTAAMCYAWPGNIRELQNLVEKLCVTCSKIVIDAADLPQSIQTAYQSMQAASGETCWHHIEELVLKEKNRLLGSCKSALSSKNRRAHVQTLEMNQDETTNCYNRLMTYVGQLAVSFPPLKREALVRTMIIHMQEELFHYCHQEKIGKLSELYPAVETLLGRSRRQIDNWRGDLNKIHD